MNNHMNTASPIQVGEVVFIRTVSFYYLGKIEEILTAESGTVCPGLVLSSCSWVADTKRFGDYLAGKVTDYEVEVYPEGPVFIASSPILDVCRWNNPLPTSSR